MASMWNAESDYDYDIETGNEDRWGDREEGEHGPLYADENPCEPVSCRCDLEWPCPSFAPKTAMLKKAALAMGFEVVEVSVVEPEPTDYVGLPDCNTPETCGVCHECQKSQPCSCGA